MSTNNYINELQRKNALYNMYFNGTRKYYTAGYCGGNITPDLKPKPPADVEATTQNDILNVYFANVTGKKKYNSVWSKIINMIFRLVREGEYGNAA